MFGFVYCIPRYRDYSPAKIGFFTSHCLKPMVFFVLERSSLSWRLHTSRIKRPELKPDDLNLTSGPNRSDSSHNHTTAWRTGPKYSGGHDKILSGQLGAAQVSPVLWLPGMAGRRPTSGRGAAGGWPGVVVRPSPAQCCTLAALLGWRRLGLPPLPP